MTNTGYPPVPCPYAFAQTMEQHWVETLGNASSPALRAVWEQMATAFGRSLFLEDQRKWQILQPPTGSGKTQGTALYCSVLAKENLRSEVQAGVLIVSRLKSECDQLVSTINRHTGAEVAYAHHSDHQLTNIQLRQAMILVITHAALTRAFEGITKQTVTRWPDLSNWSHGPRRLIIVDEALSGVVQQSTVSSKHLSSVIGLARDLGPVYHAEVQALEALYQALQAKSQGSPSSDLMWPEAPKELPGLPPEFDLYRLRRRLEAERLDNVFLGTNSPMDQKRASRQIAVTLRSAEAILTGWAFYLKKGSYHTANSALMLIPEDAPPAVVLDATASQSELWELLGDRVSIIPVPEGARSYESVNLHVARARGMGKDKMIERQHSRLSRLFNEMSRLGPKCKVLLCTHFDLEAHARTYAPTDNSWSFAHWGAIDGRNDWQNCDTVILFGLPYLSPAWSKGLIGATQGVDQVIAEAAQGSNLGRRLQQRQLAVSCIQALNRVRCRKVIDAKGNCAATDAYIVLPPDDDGDAILAAVVKEMPGIRVKQWDFEPDGPGASLRRQSFHEAIVSYMAAQLPGLIYLETLKAALKIGSLKAIRSALNDPRHSLTKALASIGVTYVRQGLGRGTKTYLMKAS